LLTLLEKQQTFSVLLSKFINDLTVRGYKITLGEAFRPLGVAAIYAAQGEGIKNSLHTMRLAIDLNIFLGGQYLQSENELAIPGALWESYSTELVECSWGGRFTPPDTDHFSIANDGTR
jgi:hypothetical protein